MHGRSLKQATRQFLAAHLSLEGGVEVRVTDPPGRPVGVVASWAIMIHDSPQTLGAEGKIGQYIRFGCVLTVSQKLDGVPHYDEEEFQDARRVGLADMRDNLAIFLHRWRWTILGLANTLADADSTAGPVNNLVEAPLPVSVPALTRRGPEWWGEAIGRLVHPNGVQAEEAQVYGYSTDIQFGRALAINTGGMT